MRKRTRLATTAGVTVLGFTAMSGMNGAAQAGTGGLDLPGSLGKTVDGILKPATESSSASGLHVNVPVHVGLSAPSGRSGSAPALKADVQAGAKASTRRQSARGGASVHLCVAPPRACAHQPAPPSPIPPAPPTPPPAPPVVNPIPAPPPAGKTLSAGSLTVIGNALPFTGGPIGALALLGATAVLTGAAGIAGTRLKAARNA